ncbi:Type IV secretory pathway, VirB4 components (plasmid) [Phaeobacter inhibens]|uniref:Type IV secretory pathway, VirB4 component n=1 Tax=Phaeobacter inhibens TaxID=221822 RepID=A0ABM6RKQ1_9RHOB|nr:ATP-binding protein [Phaeobacter inhibens]AUQ52488.1 Type IV secretory pathway, VirB4 components [Phaeobacter inhibens]AUQ97093.1 Type IV secretory pathway, VirB4 component [Phaeobacter inhibens]AUR22293.1 Type IV secretory pathway, VirB4 component [Phaeobacter inhibens]
MSIFNFSDSESLGSVISVDTAAVTIRVDDLDRLKRLQVNRLVVLQSSKPGQHLIGIVVKITRKPDTRELEEVELGDEDLVPNENNLVKVTLIGTLLDRVGTDQNVFRRTLETVPEIDANCFSLDGERLTKFMQVISDVKTDGPKLSLGHFTLDDEAVAYLNGNKLFQRHAVIVGSTGSGKSWTTARLLDQIAELPQANAVLFDIHGEYRPLKSEAFRHLRIAGPSDIEHNRGLADGVLHLPYWLLGYEALLSLFVDRSDQNAPNQSMIMTRAVVEAKKSSLDPVEHKEILENFTIDSPVPFDINTVLDKLKKLDEEMVPGTGNREKQGPYHGKLSRLIGRLEAKRHDRRLAFLFQPPPECMDMAWLEQMVHAISAGRGAQDNNEGGIKIIDFSEVPSDVLPLMVSLLAQILFSTSLWTKSDKRHPIAIMCDEAHLYIPERMQADSSDAVAVEIFERIAKEGRKYGIGLVVISQRPSEVNRTVLSQCNNVVAMRLTNSDDQSVIKRLLPDSLGSFGDLLPVLDIGEALVVGDASLLPTRIRIAEPKMKPDSQTVAFWDRWNEDTPISDTQISISSWRKQSSS